jgi:hypothetical protein
MQYRPQYNAYGFVAFSNNLFIILDLLIVIFFRKKNIIIAYNREIDVPVIFN